MKLRRVKLSCVYFLPAQMMVYNTGLIPSRFYEVLLARDKEDFSSLLISSLLIIIGVSLVSFQLREKKPPLWYWLLAHCYPQLQLKACKLLLSTIMKNKYLANVFSTILNPETTGSSSFASYILLITFNFTMDLLWLICCLELYLPGTVWGGGNLISQVVFVSFFCW